MQRACSVYNALKQRLDESRRHMQGMLTECQVLAQSVNQLHQDHQRAEEMLCRAATSRLKPGRRLAARVYAARRQHSAPAAPVAARRVPSSPAGRLTSNSGSPSAAFSRHRGPPGSASVDCADTVLQHEGSPPATSVSLRVAPWQGTWRLAAELPASQTSMDAAPPPVVPALSASGQATAAAESQASGTPATQPNAAFETRRRILPAAPESPVTKSLPKDALLTSELQHAQQTRAAKVARLESELAQLERHEASMREEKVTALSAERSAQTRRLEVKAEACSSTLEACSTACGTASPATPPSTLSTSGTEATSPLRPSQIGSRLNSQLPPPPPQSGSWQPCPPQHPEPQANTTGAPFSQQAAAVVQAKMAEAGLQEELASAALTFSQMRNLREQFQALEATVATKLQLGQERADSAEQSKHMSSGQRRQRRNHASQEVAHRSERRSTLQQQQVHHPQISRTVPGAIAEEQKALGNAAFERGDYNEAVRHFTEGLSHDPSNHTLYANRSACHAHVGHFHESLQDAEECVKLRPDQAIGYKRKGYAQFFLKEHEQAQETYMAGLRAAPKDVELMEGLQKTVSQTCKDKKTANLKLLMLLKQLLDDEVDSQASGGFCADASNRSVASGLTSRRVSELSQPSPAHKQESQSAIAGEQGHQLQFSGEEAAFDKDQGKSAAPRFVESELPRRSVVESDSGQTPKAADTALLKIFSHCDRDGDGKMNKRDIIKVCQESPEVADFLRLPRKILQEDEARTKMEYLFQAVDKDNDRRITWEEFKLFYMSGAEQHLKQIFHLCDRNGDGTVQQNELMKVLHRHEDIKEFFDKRHDMGGSDDEEDWQAFVRDLCNETGDEVTWDRFRSFYLRRRSVLADAPHAAPVPPKCRAYTVAVEDVDIGDEEGDEEEDDS